MRFPYALQPALALLLSGAGQALPQPDTATASATRGGISLQNGRRLTGRFLQITDVHPDPFYKIYSGIEKPDSCHWGSGTAGFYGAERSSCDTPVSLVNATFKWIEEHIKGDIDFVVWTGDSARHDNDKEIPRSEQQILEQNRLLVSKFVEVFGKPDNINDPDPTNDFVIPIVPSYGNNDILPHNIFTKGPNRWTTEYLDLWRHFIPEEQRHQFQRGGWFSVEVIPNKLAVFSLNTLYFFDSNSAVDGCAARSDPGYEHLDWLRIQLQFLRERGMKAILMGHVPPARTEGKKNWDETCWQKYTLWTRQYRDVIVGSLFGHMNLDHFILQDFHDISKHASEGYMDVSDAKATGNEEFTIAAAGDYLTDLRDEWSKLPKAPKPSRSRGAADRDRNHAEEADSLWQSVMRMTGRKGRKAKPDPGQKYLDKIGGQYGERYSLAFVSPSVVPNYFPTLRIFEYNITGLEDHASFSPETLATPTVTDEDPLVEEEEEEEEEEDSSMELDSEEVQTLVKHKSKKHKQKKKPKSRSRKYRFIVPSPPSETSPPGPAYSPQTLSLLGYTQYFANLTHINNDLHTEGKKPHPKPFKYEFEYDTFNDTIYKLEDLTVRNYIDLAGRIGQSKSKKANRITASNMEYELPEDDDMAAEIQSSDCTSAIAECDVQSEKRKKHKKKHKKGKKARNDAWFTFVKRAFVGTMDLDEIRDEFGVLDVDDDRMMDEPSPSMEL